MTVKTGAVMAVATAFSLVAVTALVMAVALSLIGKVTHGFSLLFVDLYMPLTYID